MASISPPPSTPSRERAGAALETAYVSLGSNLGDRDRHLARALAALRSFPGVEELVVSPIYETVPVGPGEQGLYLNAVARIRTTLSPRALLEGLLALETRSGRRRSGVRNAARTLDLDLLLYGERCIREPDLEVPHPRLHERGFVLEPLRDLAPGLVHPIRRRTIEELAGRARDPAAVRRR